MAHKNFSGCMFRVDGYCPPEVCITPDPPLPHSASLSVVAVLQVLSALSHMLIYSAVLKFTESSLCSLASFMPSKDSMKSLQLSFQFPLTLFIFPLPL